MMYRSNMYGYSMETALDFIKVSLQIIAHIVCVSYMECGVQNIL